ncbi:MAG: hypothetical protein GKS02_14390 [Alphaproteobacteria bacterium]|nr:hypothetical protein [Alphaproteobacteria bacterium]
MQPLKIIALLLGALPIAAFLITLILSDGAPLKSLAPREESGPVAATRALPLAALERPALERPEKERPGSVAAAGIHKTEDIAPSEYGEDDPEPVYLVDPDRDAQLFMTLFGTPHQ